MKKLMLAAALCTGILGAQAQTALAPATTTQTTTPAPKAHPAQNCMMATDADWKSLGLSAEQMTKVKAIQDKCMKECGAMLATDPKMGKMMDTHEAEVKGVLTPAQYDQWMKWCAAQVKPPMDKKTEKKM